MNFLPPNGNRPSLRKDCLMSCEQVCVPGRLRFHDLRHGYEPDASVGRTDSLRQPAVGHSSAAFTLSTYTHLIQQGRRLDKEETLQRLFAAARGDRAPRVPQKEVAQEDGTPETLDKSGAGDRI